MPKTFNQTQEEEREEREAEDTGRGKDIGPGGEAPVTFDGENLGELSDEFKDWVTATPDEIRHRLVQERERIQQEGENLEFQLSQQIGGAEQLLDSIQGTSFGLQNLQSALQFTDLPSQIVVNDLGVEDLLQLILRTQVNYISPNITSVAQLLKVISSSNAQMLAAMQNVLSEVSPANQFVVTGRNVISNDDTPEPVIPDSDNIEIPTRTLYIRADSTNQDIVVFGDDDVDPSTGFFLKTGEVEVIDQNIAAEVLYMAGTSGDAVRLMGFL